MSGQHPDWRQRPCPGGEDGARLNMTGPLGTLATPPVPQGEEVVQDEASAEQVVAGPDAVAEADALPTVGDELPLAQRKSAERRPLVLGVLFSLSVHALLLSLSFSGQGLGLPGFGFPWEARRTEVPDLYAVLLPAPAPLPSPIPSPIPAPIPVPSPPSAPLPNAGAEPAVPAIGPEPEPVAAGQPIEHAPPSVPHEKVNTVAQSDESAWTVPTAPEVAPVTAVVPSATNSEVATPQPQQAKAEREVAERIEAERQEAARVEAQRQLVVRQAAARQEAARQEAARQEAVRAEQGRHEALRQEAARAEAERKAASRQEATQQEAAKAAAAKADVARQEAARVEAARLAAIQAEAEKREERLRAIGRQLNEEADRRDAAAAQRQLSPSASNVRRGRLFGRTDSNAELIAYAEAWALKIQLNMTFDMVRDAAKQPHADPLVTVAIRSDGSVEGVTFVLSSGVPAIDEAIRRIVQSQANYPAFPPGLLRDYDVVEIRRTWHFDMAIRLY